MPIASNIGSLPAVSSSALAFLHIPILQTISVMASRPLEACFDRLSVNDENDPGENARLYQKTKVCFLHDLFFFVVYC